MTYSNVGGGYAILLDGSGYTNVTNCNATNVTMGFLAIGDDSPSNGTNDHRSQRTIDYAINNVFSNCHVKGHTKHAFNINASYGNIINACTSDNFNGDSTYPSFQNKHSSTDDTKHNVFIGCIAKNCVTAFYSQDGSFVKFADCIAQNVENGFWVNNAPNCTLSNCTVENFSNTSVRLEASARPMVNGLIVSPSNSTTTTLIKIINSSNASLDNISRTSKVGIGLDIDANSSNTLIGRGVRLVGAIINDLGNNTIYPITIGQEFDLVNAIDSGLFSAQRGLHIARIHIITTKAITGSVPTVNIGIGTIASSIADNVTPIATLNGLARPPVLSNLTSGQFIRITSNGGAASGKILVLIDGLELL